MDEYREPHETEGDPARPTDHNLNSRTSIAQNMRIMPHPEYAYEDRSYYDINDQYPNDADFWNPHSRRPEYSSRAEKPVQQMPNTNSFSRPVFPRSYPQVPQASYSYSSSSFHPAPSFQQTHHTFQGTYPPPYVYTDHFHQPVAPVRNEIIEDVRPQDVLCGRGAPTSWHEGNQFFKRLVDYYQPSYLAARRSDKPEIALRIVNTIIHERKGRFLKRTKVHGAGPSGHFSWQDIGETRAYEKACQALREGAPEIRRQMIAAQKRKKENKCAEDEADGDKRDDAEVDKDRV